MKIAIIDYDTGNVQSILNALEYNGVHVVLTREKSQILDCDGVILPGVGAYPHGMRNLQQYGLIEAIREFSKTQKPLMGICLGMQMLFDEGEEFGKTEGLKLIPGKVFKLPVQDGRSEKLPHVSWNEIRGCHTDWSGTILDSLSDGSDVYFVHSYIAKPENDNDILSVTEYSGYEFCSSVQKGNVYGCQFHPEKSGKIGLKIIENFIQSC